MRQPLVILVLNFLLLITSANACIWDRDTLRIEADAKPDILETTTGRFPRFPDRYYEMRLERVSEELNQKPDALDLYDDAGAAADRLGNGKAAIEWMRKKKAILEKQNIPDTAEHTYRYHANLGTFLFHHWIRSGASDDQIDMAKEGRDHIANAIELNPNAHFGREKFQLMAMDWIIEKDQQSFSFIDGYQDDLDSAIEGVSGLIRLGNGWNSPDVFLALNTLLLRKHEAYLATMAFSRAQVLLSSGRRSFSIAVNKSEHLYDDPFRRIQDQSYQKLLRNFYQKARAEADNWQAARFAYMEGKFAKGLHPDNDPDFWDNFSYAGKPPL